MISYIHILILLFCSLHVYSQQNEKISCQSIHTDIGLSQSSVLSIEQDSYGFIWLGTRDGLNLYNGSQIQIYKNIPGDEKSIAGNLINDIAEDTHRNLWIAHNNGISLLDRKTGHFTNYQITAHNKEIRSLAIIDGQLWACGWSGLFILDENDRFTPYSPNNNDIKLYLSTSKIFQARTKDGYWIATTNNGLCYLDTKSKQVEKVFSGVYHDVRIEDIVFHPNGKMYVATYGKGLLECDADGNIIRRWNRESTGGRFNIDNIRSLAIDKSGLVWIGGFQGLATLNTTDHVIQKRTLTHAVFEVDDISVRSLFVDRNGSVWMGTYHHGAFLYDDYFARFATTPLRLNNSTPIHAMISAFALSSTGKAFIATENGYLFEYPNYSTPATSQAIHQPRGGHNLVFKSLYYHERKEQLWIGTLRDGLFLKNKENNLLKVPLLATNERLQQDTIDYGVINNIIPYDDEHIWLLTDKGGALHLFDLNKQHLIDYPASEALSKWVNRGSGKHICKLTDTDYLLATKGSGLLHFKNNGDTTINRILHDVHDINHIAVYQDTLYVSTQNDGLYILDKNFSVVKQYTTTDFLRNNNVLSTFKDEHGRIWINTFNGLNLIKHNGELSTYDSKNGFQLAEVNAWKQAIDQQNNTVFFAGGKDVWIHFEPNKLSDNSYVPIVYLTAVRLSNKTISDLEYLNSTYNEKNGSHLKLNADESLLTIEFAGTNYLMPQNSRFRYMMEGYDRDWIYTDHQGFARYNKLPAGKYIFKVQASNNDGVWSENVATLNIRKYPPMWASWQAYTFYVLILFAALYYLRRNELKKRDLKEEIQSKEKEKQLIAEAHALKIKYFNDISHEIRTPLSLILHPIEELMEIETLSPKEKRKVLSMQYHGKNLLLLVNQLLEINRLELKKENLNTTPTYLKELVSIIYNSFQPIAQSSGILWEVDILETTDHPLEIDRLQMEKVLLNLLSNAFKFTSKGGTVKLTVSTSETDSRHAHLRIKVADNGIGITAQDLPHIFERLYKGEHQNNVTGSGIGLALVKAIVVDLMKGSINVNSTWKQGTTFEINVPHIPIVPHRNAEEYKNSLLTPTYIYDFPKDEDEDRLPTRHDDKKSILLVEDNIILSKMLTDYLGDHYTIFPLTNAEDAIIFLKDNEVDLILSDIMLPGMNGKDFCVEIKSNIITSHIPFILLTAVDGEESIIAGLELGADDYITKPFIMKELFLRINNILKQRKRWQNYIHDKNAGKKPTVRLNKYDEELMKNIDNCLNVTLDDATYTVEDLSKEVGLSRVHLFRKLKALTGFSPSQYIRNYKLDKALAIIETEKIRVADLAYKVGFQDPNYFLKCFKEKFGKTPSEFAKKFS